MSNNKDTSNTLTIKTKSYFCASMIMRDVIMLVVSGGCAYVVFLLFSHLFHIKDIEYYADILSEILYGSLFVSLLVCFHIEGLFLAYYDTLSVKNEEITGAVLADTLFEYYKNISKVKVSYDNFLVIYKNKSDTKKRFSLERFETEDVQSLINVLSKKVPLVIDGGIVVKKGYSLPNDAIPAPAEETTSAEETPSARRRTVRNETTQPVINSGSNKSEIRTGRRLELTSEEGDKPTQNGRRLEL